MKSAECRVQSELREKAAHFRGPADVLCLTALAQPLVDEMQQVIRFQAEQLDRAAVALGYILRRIGREKDLAYHCGAGTEAFARLTASLAEIKNQDVDGLRDSLFPRSSALHRRQEQEAA